MKLGILGAFICWAGTAVADAPRVVADIAPVHSLVAGVMEGVGTPELLLTSDVSPHDFALRPSDARILAEADHMVWVGEAMTPRLAQQLSAVSTNAGVTTLLSVPGWEALEADDDHGHEGTDPHAWMDPDIAALWIQAIATDLARIDPENATKYTENADLMVAGLVTLRDEVATSTTEAGRYILPHDGFGYFERRFDVPAAGVVTPSDDADPGPAHLAELRDLVVDGAVDCILLPYGPAPSWGQTLTDGSDVAVGKVDVLGTGLEIGPELYPSLIRRAAQDIVSCAAE